MPAGTPTYSSNSGVYHPPYYNNGGNGDWVDNPEAQVEYDYYKSVCKGPLPPSGDECQDYRNLSHQSQMCANLRQQWDDKWSPGRHLIEIMKEICRASKYKRLADDCERQKKGFMSLKFMDNYAK